VINQEMHGNNQGFLCTYGDVRRAEEKENKEIQKGQELRMQQL
jgi:hypothetical protein